jgi:hypothetical protein
LKNQQPDTEFNHPLARSRSARRETQDAIGPLNFVSAGAKILIVPVEFSPPLDVVNRSPHHSEEVPKLVKGERRARTKRTATARNEHPGHQQVDRLSLARDNRFAFPRIDEPRNAQGPLNFPHTCQMAGD